MADSVTVKDIARKAGVSIGTVSRVFNHHSNVTEEMRDRVLQAAAALGYKKLVAKDPPGKLFLSIQRIGFLFCSPLPIHKDTALSNPFWPYILNGVGTEANQFGLKVIFRDMGDAMQAPQESLATIQGMELDGILLAGLIEPGVISLVKSLNVPVVLVSHHLPGYPVDRVDSDDFEGARMAMKHLLEYGHRQIAYIGGPTIPGLQLDIVDLRGVGYRTTLLDAGLPVNTDLIEHGDLGPAGGYQACQRLLERKIPFTALFCANDETAVGAMEALRQAGRRIPEDVSIIGFDDTHLAAHLTPALTTVRIDKEALGALAVRRLLEQIDHPTRIGTTTFLDVELIKRASVRNLLSS